MSIIQQTRYALSLSLSVALSDGKLHQLLSRRHKLTPAARLISYIRRTVYRKLQSK